MYSRSAGVARSYREPKKPDRQFGLGVGRGDPHVGGGDRRLRRVVPGGLAVRLDEVRVAAGRLVERVERLGLELDRLPRGRRAQRLIGRDPVEPVDALVAEEPLGVGLGGGQQGRQVRQPGADDDQRRAGLGQLVAGGAQRRDVPGRQSPASRR